MSESALYRLASIGLVLGAALTAIASLVPSSENVKSAVNAGTYYPVALALLVGAVLIFAGWPAVYLRQRAESGWLGLVGMLLVFAVGSVVTIGFSFVQVMLFPWMASLPLSAAQFGQGPPALGIFFPIATLVVALGGVLFSVASLRARVFPRWVSIAFIVLAVLSFAANFLGPVQIVGEALYMAGLIGYGVALWLSLGARTVPSPADSSQATRPAATQ